ncbi:hypothetical protein GXW82_28565 [Streptacidiphilus sp. 4-A2]|nr:hypothetical protein [Streptacidiphilus sp. 4-A2]
MAAAKPRVQGCVEDFPAFVVVDDKGNDFFANPGDDQPLITHIPVGPKS